MPYDAVSRWRKASDRLDKVRSADWPDPARAEIAWIKLRATEATLLAPARHAGDLTDKLQYLLRVSEMPTECCLAPARRAWNLRLLRSAVRDSARIADEADLNQRREVLRCHAAGLGGGEELAIQLQAVTRQLNEVRAERDAAYHALEQANGLVRADTRR
jgi:hypothetical protein